MKNKIRKIRDGKLSIPHGWIEINPQYSSEATHVAICVVSEHIGVYYADNEASELTQEQLMEIATYMKQYGDCTEIKIYGLIDAVIMKNTENIRNPYEVQLIRYGKEN